MYPAMKMRIAKKLVQITGQSTEPQTVAFLLTVAALKAQHEVSTTAEMNAGREELKTGRQKHKKEGSSSGKCTGYKNFSTKERKEKNEYGFMPGWLHEEWKDFQCVALPKQYQVLAVLMC